MQAEDYIDIKNRLPVELCKELIRECNKKKWQKHVWNNYKTGENTSESTKELDVMHCTQEQQNKIRPYLIKALNEYEQKVFDLYKGSIPARSDAQNSWSNDANLMGFLTAFSTIRFNKYEVGTTMRIHYDNIHGIFDGKRKGIPIVSIVGNLNEDYEGAEFILRGKEIKLKTGDLLLFPSGIVYPHMVKESKKGIRYSFVSWAF